MSEEQINEILEKEERPSFADKFSGIFISPAEIFEKIKQTSPHFTDWVFPIVLFVLVGSLVNFLAMSDPVISMKIQEKQMAKIEENFEELVEQGQMTQEQVDEQLDMIREKMEKQMESGRYIQALSLLVVSFIFFFVIAGFYYLVVKFALKGKGTYSAAMTAYGLPYYILALQFLMIVIYMFITQSPAENLSVATLLDYPKDTYTGIILGKLDIFSIWFYYLVSLGFAKLFDIDFKKTAITIFGIWIGVSLFFHFLAEQVPMLKLFGM